jgi:hypothetical protein
VFRAELDKPSGVFFAQTRPHSSFSSRFSTGAAPPSPKEPGHVFARLPWIIVIRFLWGMWDAFFDAFVPAAKAPIGRAYEEGGHAQRHQSLAVGIGADALGGLC